VDHRISGGNFLAGFGQQNLVSNRWKCGVVAGAIPSQLVSCLKLVLFIINKNLTSVVGYVLRIISWCHACVICYRIRL